MERLLVCVDKKDTLAPICDTIERVEGKGESQGTPRL